MKKTLALVASALLAAPLAVFAAPGDGPVKGDRSFTVSGSGTSDKDFDNSAYGVNGELGYFLTDKWQAGLRQSVNGVDQDQGGNSWAGATRGFIVYNFLDGNYRPYLGANLGGIYGEDVSNTGAAGIEAGLKLYVLKKTYINFGIEYSWLFEDTDDFDNKSNDGLYLYNIGVGFNW
jgi:hypothetical protein